MYVVIILLRVKSILKQIQPLGVFQPFTKYKAVLVIWRPFWRKSPHPKNGYPS